MYLYIHRQVAVCGKCEFSVDAAGVLSKVIIEDPVAEVEEGAPKNPEPQAVNQP